MVRNVVASYAIPYGGGSERKIRSGQQAAIGAHRREVHHDARLRGQARARAPIGHNERRICERVVRTHNGQHTRPADVRHVPGERAGESGHALISSAPARRARVRFMPLLGQTHGGAQGGPGYLQLRLAIPSYVS